MQLQRPVVRVKHILPLLCACLFLVQLGLSLSDVPSTMVMQDIICREYLGVASNVRMPQAQCLTAPIQQELNIVNVGSLISVTIAGMKSSCYATNARVTNKLKLGALVALPYGFLSGRYGRVPILAASILGMLLAQGYVTYILMQKGRVPLRAVWGLGVPLLVGGGRSTAEAVVFTIISDASTGLQR